MVIRLSNPWFIVVLFCLSSEGGWAFFSQGGVSGVIRDPRGSIVRGAEVELTNAQSGQSLSTVTDDQGQYSFVALPPGRYRVRGVAAGFDAVIRDDILVTEGQPAVADLVLNIRQKETVVVVTAPAMDRPLVVETDPRAPRQPIPAHDGADYLKTIPGFSIIRKGGTDGDPVLRGMAGSRVNVLMDGQVILGGCGGRMDPPTAYVFPSAYDRITVLKGPESVQYGPNASAGTVLFEHDMREAERTRATLNGNLTVGSYGRHDEMMDARAEIPKGFMEAILTRSHSDDYRDGNGTAVHSLYTRWSGNAALGWTPNSDTLLEMSLAKSNGEAAYADRSMDGSRFARDNVSIRFDKRRISSPIKRVEAQYYYNYIDHVMDNYSLRTPGMMYTAMNPDRVTSGGRAALTFTPGNKTIVVVGSDTQHNQHRGRSAMGKSSADLATSAYLAAPRVEDMRFNQIGAFAEVTQNLNQRNRLVGGFRTDWHRANDSRMCVNSMMCMPSSPLRNDTQGAVDRNFLMSGFGRYERDIHGGAGTFYAGVGHVERFPDYWERLYQDPVTLKSAFLSTKPEKTTQLDIGGLWRSDRWSGSLSGFYGRVRDYILIRWNPTPTLTRNVDATTIGGEGDLAFRIASNLTADAALAYVHGNNDTDHKPLAQQPPLEARFGLTYTNRGVSVGALSRLVGPQDRYDKGSGNIVVNGMDLGRTAGFAVFSLNGGYRIKRILLITGGVDNILDKAYAEHLSKSGAMIPGFAQMLRINEPGRTFWLKANFNFD